MGIRVFLISMLMVGVLTACNLGNNGQAASTTVPLDEVTPEGVPEIRIVSPTEGDEFVAGEEILVSIEANDSVGVTRVQLLANNQIVKSVSSESLQGELTMSAILDYTPQLEGSVTLRVLAFRGAVSSTPDQIQVEVRSSQEEVVATPAQISNVPDIPNDGVCRALISVGLNFREGPSTDFDRIRVLSSGTLAPIVGRIGDNSWWQLNVDNTRGWVSAEFTTEFGNCANVPVVQLPTEVPPATTAPTVTPIPTATANNGNGSGGTTGGGNNSGQPDLLVGAITGDRSVVIPSNVSSTSETYTIRVQNTGTGSSGQFASTIFVNGVERDLGVVAELASNASRDFDVQLEFTESGTVNLEVVVDVDNQVQEISEVNNRGQISITVGQ